MKDRGHRRYLVRVILDGKNELCSKVTETFAFLLNSMILVFEIAKVLLYKEHIGNWNGD